MGMLAVAWSVAFASPLWASNPLGCDFSGLVSTRYRASDLRRLDAGQNATVYTDGKHAFKEPKHGGTGDIAVGLALAYAAGLTAVEPQAVTIVDASGVTREAVRMELHRGKPLQALSRELESKPLTAEEKARIREGFATLEKKVRAAADNGFTLGDFHNGNIMIDRETGAVAIIDFDHAGKGLSIADCKRKISDLQKMIDFMRPPHPPTIQSFKSLQKSYEMKMRSYENLPVHIAELRKSLLGE